ncbi:MAG: hypothetical protein ACOZQL_10770 [Myxococcota bacterium]
MKIGDVVRPVVTIAGLNAKLQYVVQHVERGALGYELAFLTDEAGDHLHAVENAHLVLEVVRAPTMKPAAAFPN